MNSWIVGKVAGLVGYHWVEGLAGSRFEKINPQTPGAGSHSVGPAPVQRKEIPLRPSKPSSIPNEKPLSCPTQPTKTVEPILTPSVSPPPVPAKEPKPVSGIDEEWGKLIGFAASGDDSQATAVICRLMESYDQEQLLELMTRNVEHLPYAYLPSELMGRYIVSNPLRAEDVLDKLFHICPDTTFVNVLRFIIENADASTFLTIHSMALDLFERIPLEARYSDRVKVALSQWMDAVELQTEAIQPEPESRHRPSFMSKASASGHKRNSAQLTDAQVQGYVTRINTALSREDSNDELANLYAEISSELLQRPYVRRTPDGCFEHIELPSHLLIALRTLLATMATRRFEENLAIESPLEKVERLKQLLPQDKWRNIESGYLPVWNLCAEAEAWGYMLRHYILPHPEMASDIHALRDVKARSCDPLPNLGGIHPTFMARQSIPEALQEHAELYTFLIHRHPLNSEETWLKTRTVPDGGGFYRLSQEGTDTEDGRSLRESTSTDRLKLRPGTLNPEFIHASRAIEVPPDTYDRIVVIAFPRTRETLFVSHIGADRQAGNVSLTDKIKPLLHDRDCRTDDPVNIVYFSLRDQTAGPVTQLQALFPQCGQFSIFTPFRRRTDYSCDAREVYDPNTFGYRVFDFRPAIRPVRLLCADDGSCMRMELNDGHVCSDANDYSNPIRWSAENVHRPANFLLCKDKKLVQSFYRHLRCSLTEKSFMDITEPVFDQCGNVYEGEVFRMKTRFSPLLVGEHPKRRARLVAGSWLGTVVDKLKQDHETINADGTNSRNLAFTKWLIQEMSCCINLCSVLDIRKPVFDSSYRVFEHESLLIHLESNRTNPRNRERMTTGDIVVSGYLFDIVEELRAMNRICPLQELENIREEDMLSQTLAEEPDSEMEVEDDSLPATSSSCSSHRKRTRSSESETTAAKKQEMDVHQRKPKKIVKRKAE